MPLARISREKQAGLAFWAARVLEECDKASAGFEADPVHDLRVAIRRCRSMADGFRSVDPDPAWKEMKRLAKPLFASLGELRDTQVMMEWVAKLVPSDDVLAQSLATALQKKEAAQKDAAQVALADFDRKQWAGLNDHLVKRTGRIPLEGLIFQHLALERWTEARALHRQALRNRSGVAYHRLRIGIKRLRYTAENFLPERHERWSKDLRELQDALGEVHDLDVLRSMIRAHPHIEAAERQIWHKRISEEREKRLHLYRHKMLGEHSLWKVWRGELPAGQALEEAAMEKLRSWGSFLDPDVAHSARVTRLALQLFDGLSQCRISCLGPGFRRILEAAAMLHDVGKGGGNGRGGHQKRSYRMVSKLAPPLGWSVEDMHCVAAIVRYHRGRLPVSSNSSFVGLSAKMRRKVLPVIGVLRLANAFDEAHDGRIATLSVERKDGVFTVYTDGLQPISPAAERIARSRYLLETTCQCPILVRPMLSERGSRSARMKPRRQAAAVMQGKRRA